MKDGDRRRGWVKRLTKIRVGVKKESMRERWEEYYYIYEKESASYDMIWK